MKTTEIETELISPAEKPEGEASTPAGPRNETTGTTNDGASVGGPREKGPEPLLSVTGDSYAMMDVSKLQPHPFNVKVYGEETLDDEFVKNIEQRGIYVPLIVTTAGKIISGHRRYAAAVKLKWSQVPVIVREFSGELAEREALIDYNRQREKDNLQKTREFVALAEIESERAKLRLITRGAAAEGRKNLAQAEPGKARDKAAESLGLSGVTLEKGEKVLTHIDALRGKGENAKADKLAKALNKSFDAGVKEAISMKLIRKPTGAEPKTVAGKTQPTTPPAAIPPAATIVTEGKTENDLAIEHADVLVTYFKKTKIKSLTEGQRRDWTRILGPVNKWFKALGV